MDARGRAPVAERPQRERALDAVVLHERAARMEAADRREGRRGPAARPGIVDEQLADVVDVGHRAQKAQRVRVPRLAEHRLDGAGLDHLAGVHHGDALAGLRDHGEVVRDEDDADAELARAARRAA